METQEALNDLFARSQDGQRQPSTDSLTLTLQHMLRVFHQAFIIIDALDECKEREELLGLIENIVNWKLDNLHLLATSRRERDIEETLGPLTTGQIRIESALINTDIHAYICERIQKDGNLKRRPANIQLEIEKTLMDGAHGM
jgi:hypothetical protein